MPAACKGFDFQQMTLERAVIEQLNGIFRELFMDETIVLTAATTADDIEGWDSFAHLNVIISIENYFGIDITDDEIPTLRNIGDILSLIARKLSETPSRASNDAP